MDIRTAQCDYQHKIFWNVHLVSGKEQSLSCIIWNRCRVICSRVACSFNFGRHFWFSLSLYLEMKMLNSLSHILVIWVFHSFSLVLVITFYQTAVTNIYFGSYFISSIQTKIVINSSLFRPNQLSMWYIWIKDWIWKKLEYIFIFLVEIKMLLIFQIQ